MTDVSSLWYNVCMLSEPGIHICVYADEYVEIYTTQPITVKNFDTARVRFDENGVLDAMVISPALYRLVDLVTHHEPLTLESFFSLLLLSGSAWKIEKPSVRPGRMSRQIITLIREHQAINRGHWFGGRKMLAQRVGTILLPDLLKPARWKKMYRALVFEWRWWRYQQNSFLMRALVINRMR